jgi:hypothetical protein
MPSYFTPKKNAEFILYLSLVSQSNTKIMQTNPTIAAGDFQVSTDGGALSSLSTLPVVTPAGSKLIKVTLNASEMNGDNVTILASDVSGNEWADLVTNIHTTANQIDDLASPETVSREVGLVISGHGLDHLLAASVAGTDITDNSIFARLVSKEATADWDDYVNTTDSLQAIRDQGDSAWITAVGFSTLSFGEVNREIGLVVSGHGLDHLLQTSVAGVDVADNSIVAKLVSENGTADWDSFNNTTDSLEAIRNRGDVDWITATGFSTHTPADINTQIGLVVSGHGLDHLLQTSVTGVDIADNSIIARLVSKEATADWDDYNNTTDSLEALRDQGDSAWITAVGFSTLSSDDVSREIGLVVSGHNLDNFVFTTANKVDARIDYVGSNSVTTPNDFKADVSNLDVTVSSLADSGEVNREIGLVISGHGLDHLVQTSVAGTDITDDSLFAKLVSKEATADWDDFVNTTDSLQAIRDRGDAAWTSGGGLTAGDVNTQVGLVISGHGLDHLLLQSVTGTDVTDNSVFAKLVSKEATADWDDFDNTTDSLQALRDQGDLAWITAAGFSTHSAADISREIGLVVSGHNLDDFVFTTANKVDVRVDYVGANPVTTPNDFKANVTNLDVAVSSRVDSGEVNREIGLVISGHGLDHLLSQSVAGSDITDNSIFARLVSASATADWDSFDNTSDSLEAIRDRGDAEWVTGGAGSVTVADISREIGLVISGHGLDHLLLQAVVGTDITDNSVFAKLVSKEATADWDDYVNTTDSLEAIRDQGDAAWVTGGAGSVTVADINREIGLVVSGHGLDHLLLKAVIGTDVTDNSIFAKLVSASATADWDTFVNTDDSLQAIRDRGDTAWVGGGGLTTGDINTQVGLVISGHGLDHLLLQAVAGSDITDNSVFARLVSSGTPADWDDFINTTDSLQAIRDVEPHGTAMRGTDGANTVVPDIAGTAPTAVEVRDAILSDSTPFAGANIDAAISTLATSAEVNREMGLVISGHGLDNFVFTTANKVDVRVDYVGANLVTTPDDFKANIGSLATSAEVSREIGLVVSGHGLDHLLLTSVAGTDIADNSIFARLVSASATADWDTYVNTTDSLQAIRDRGDVAWIGDAGLTAGDISREIGLVVSGHNLDSFVFTTSNKVDARVDYVGANPVTTPDDFKAVVTNLDVAVSSLANPAEVSREIGLVISGHGLDHLLLKSVVGTDITDNSVLARLVSASATADWDDFVNTTDSLQAIRDNILTSGNLPTNFSIFSIDASGRIDVSKFAGATEPVTNLKAAVETLVTGTVDTTNFASTTTEFESDDITEATADHFNGREIIFTSGVLQDQGTSISDYSLASGRGHFTVVTLTEPAGNNDTFIIV